MANVICYMLYVIYHISYTITHFSFCQLFSNFCQLLGHFFLIKQYTPTEAESGSKMNHENILIAEQ